MKVVPMRIRVQGTLTLTEEDVLKALYYHDHFVSTGAIQRHAFDSAYLQIAQDLLGGTGFGVEEVWPEPIGQQDSQGGGDDS